MSIPRDRSFDSSLAMLSDPYGFIAKRCARNGSDAFETRLMLRKAVCVVGEEASRMFNQPDRFTRRGAVPVTALMLLQDFGSAHVLDGESHRHRKRMLMSLMTPTSVAGLVDRVETEWRRQVRRWESMREVVLAREVQDVLTRAVCAWAGLSIEDREASRRARELGSMYEAAGALGPRNWRAQLLRMRTERWIRAVVEDVRAGRRTVPAGSPIDVIVRYRGTDGQPLEVKHAAVEVINLLRPTVAVERFITFAALALHDHPECRERLAAGDDTYAEHFVQEVRRYYPFFPMVGGRALVEFEWRGHRFTPGSWVLLDLYGTNHDYRRWEDPDSFRPDRFASPGDLTHALVPQGGGEHLTTHRCAGEAITIEIVKRVARLLASAMDYDVPLQDLSIRMSRMPAIPRSRFVMRHVRLRATPSTSPVHA